MKLIFTNVDCLWFFRLNLQTYFGRGLEALARRRVDGREGPRDTELSRSVLNSALRFKRLKVYVCTKDEGLATTSVSTKAVLDVCFYQRKWVWTSGR